LIGLWHFLQVQNKASIAANVTQHEIIQETAERQRREDKAAKQLERVQLQMAERVWPLHVKTTTAHFGWFTIAKVRRPSVRHGVAMWSFSFSISY
jgi:hypothetical protein